MRRVLILGSPGSGKSTLAKRLGAKLGLPVIHLDQEFWTPGWVSLSKEAFEARCRELVAREAWVMDGNYGSTFAVRLPAADTVVYLEVSRWICMWRAAKRVLLHRGRTRPDMPEGCPERFDWEFFQYIWTFPKRQTPKVLEGLRSLRPDQHAVTLRSLAEVEQWLSRVGS